MRALTLGLLFLGSVAMAEAPAESPKSDEGIADGMHLELNVLGGSSLGGLTSLVTTTGFATPGAEPSGGVGYLVAKQNLIMVTLGLLAFGPGTNVGFSISPTYRRYMSPLEVGQVTPFAQGSITFGMLSPAYGPANYVFALSGGAGAEWLFVKHMGLIADVVIVYLHQNTGTNIDEIGVAGELGVTIHF